MTITTDHILNALKAVHDPDLKRDIVSLGFVKDVRIDGGQVGFVIELTTPACPVRDQLKDEARRIVAALPGVKGVDVRMTAHVRPAFTLQPAGNPAPTVKHVIPIASGKGGVGKSTVSANLAVALARTGARVGLMDGDVYGPSIPKLLGLQAAPELDEQNRITPVERHGLKVISMGFFMKPNDAVIWRGPMLHKTVQQFLGDVHWGELDYLLVDLPPGTGDVQLSLCQMIPITGAVVVSTPQDVALQVAQRAISMFNKLKAPVLGLIENMSGYACPSCGHHDNVFGSGGAEEAATRLEIPFLGAIPLETRVRESGDAGEPIVASAPASPAGRAFIAAAEALAAQISIRAMAQQDVKVTF